MARKRSGSNTSGGNSAERTEAADKYAVGYGRPPISTRFAKGTSGNPKGRRPGSKSFLAHLASTMTEKVKVREGEKVRSMPIMKAAVLTLTNGALKGNATFLRLLISLVPLLESYEGKTAVPVSQMDVHQKKAIERLMARLKLDNDET